MHTFCSHCGGVYKTRKDGNVRNHVWFDNRLMYKPWQPCPGSGKPPKSLTKD